MDICSRLMEAVESLGPGLFDLGRCVATPAALELLEKHNMFASVPLAWHQHGEFGTLSDLDRASNIAALRNGSRIFSCFDFSDGKRLYVITTEVGDDGKRASTTICLSEEN